MHISRVVIRNFRNFSLVDVPFQPRTTCIVGENNSGKSNFLFALRLAIDSNLSSRYRNLDDQDFHGGIDWTHATQVLVSVEFRDFVNESELALVGMWEVDPETARLTYRFRPRPRVREALREDEREDGTLTLEDYHWEMTGGGGENPAEVDWDQDLGTSIRFGDLQHLEVFSLPALRDVVSHLRHRRDSPLRRLFDASEIPEDEKEALVEVVARANDEVAAQDAVKAAGERIERSFQETAGSAYRMRLRLGLADPSFLSIATSMNVLLSNELLDDFEPGRNGLGLNNVLYLSMLLDYAEARRDSPESAGHLLLVEEPEAHLHPLMQRVLYSVLAAQPTQVILTTHSTHITSQAPLQSVVALGLTVTGDSRGTVPALNEDLDEADITSLERFLDATRSTLLFARRVLLVEGAAEMFLVPPLVKAVMDIDLDREGVAVVPIYGKHFRAYARLLSSRGLAQRCAVMADGDRSPYEDSDEDVPPSPEFEELRDDSVEVFLGATTFEREITMPGLLEVLARTAEELPAPKLAGELRAAIDQSDEMDDQALVELGGLVLRTAKRFGKGRFAQVAAKHAEQAEALPDYLHRAIRWIIE